MISAIPDTTLYPRLVGLGAADLGIRQDESAAHRLLDHFTAAGGYLLDTARIYSHSVPGEIGRSERISGDWLHRHGRRDDRFLTSQDALVLPIVGCHDSAQLDRTLADLGVTLAPEKIARLTPKIP